MNNNFYIRFNHKNIIPFNLKKKKLRVHANIIGSKTTNLYGFFIGGEVKFWYYHFGINGLKKDSVFLVKKNLNKKLGVFFISNFNMVEGKWLFPKIYEQYYKYYLFLKKKRMNLFRTNLIISHNYALLNNIFYIKFLNNINMNNVLKLIYFYNNYLSINMNIVNNLSYLYKFKKNFKLSLLYNNVQNKNINLWDLSPVQERFDNLKKFCWNWNFHLKHKIFKKKKISNMIKQKPFWFYQKKRWYFKQKSDLFFKKKWCFMMNKSYLNNFYLKKNIVNITQFIKMNRALNKVNKKNILFLFYVFYLHFNFIKLYKNLKKKKKKKNLIYYKFLKNNKVKELIKNNMCNIKKLYNFINFKLKKLYIKQSQLVFFKNLNKQYKKKNFIKFFLILKKKLKKFYKFKLIKKNFILSNINKYMFNNTYIMYNYLYKIWLRYNRKKKKIKLIKLYFLKKKYKKKYKKKFKYKNLYLLWLYYIIKRQFKNFKLK